MFLFSFQLTIPENLAIGKRIFRLVATDCDAQDQGLLAYSLRLKSDFGPEPKAIPFGIDSQGWITVTGPIDRETRAIYELTVSFAQVE